MSTLMNIMKDRILVVGSASPRRHLLIAGLDIPFTIEIGGNSDEYFDPTMEKQLVPLHLAKMKSNSFGRELSQAEVLLTADTLVICNGKILGKPSNRKEAIEMLQTLSGKVHTVITGVCLKSIKGEALFWPQPMFFLEYFPMKRLNFMLISTNHMTKLAHTVLRNGLVMLQLKK